MALRNTPPLKINQFLFGYDDGHRLISASQALPLESSSLLLMFSDLARGVTFQRDNYYWTGFPLQEIKSYALLKTWDAPEMSRPGCVWTHALVISFSDLARIKDLSILKVFFDRPGSAIKNFITYNQPIEIPADLLYKESILDEDIHSEDILQLLHYVYDQEPEFLLDNGLKWEIDENAWFCVWSQQWPKVRREFVFRTSGYISLKYFPHLDHISNEFSELPTSYWIGAAYKDIRDGGKFREFLWRYGADLDNGRNYFKVLAYLYELSSEPFSSTAFPKKNLFEFLHILVTVFPGENQASVIKSDIANLGEDPFSKLPKIKPFDLIEFYICEPESSSLQPLSNSVFSKLETTWDRMHSEIMSLAEHAYIGKSIWAEKLLSIILKNITSDQFLEDGWELKNIRKVVLRNRPAMLIDSNFEHLSPDEIGSLIKEVKFTSNNLGKFISKILKLKNDDLTELLFNKFPIQTLKAIVFNFIDMHDPGFSPAHKSAELIKVNADMILANGFLEHCRYTSTLLTFIHIFGFENDHIYEYGSLPWAKALHLVNDDLDKLEQPVFYSYLLVLALKRPAKGCEVIFENAFIPIHNLLWYNSLNPIAMQVVVPALPEYVGVDWWDYCRKLRKTLTKVYVDADLDQSSLKKLINSKELRTQEPKALRPPKSNSKKQKQPKSNKVKKGFFDFF